MFREKKKKSVDWYLIVSKSFNKTLVINPKFVTTNEELSSILLKDKK